MSTLNSKLHEDPIFHHAEPEFARKLNMMADAIREIQDHINGDTANADEKLTPAQKRAKAKAEAEAAAKAEEEAAKAAADAEANK